MTVWLRRCASFEEEAEADRDYWSGFAPDERVALIADLRQEWNTMNGVSEPPSRDFTEFLDLLAQHEVKALIIGAFAVAFMRSRALRRISTSSLRPLLRMQRGCYGRSMRSASVLSVSSPMISRRDV
jgi:hypothetical protein